ncbi:MAG: SOS response-associated peptidase family protein [Rhodospirillales bacterium]
MCSRFELNSTPREIAARFDLFDAPVLANRQEFRPTDRILVIDAPGQSGFRAWGIPAPWDGSPIFNARSESVAEKPTFRPYLDGRCLIPASAWFEWRKEGQGGKQTRHKTRIAPAEESERPFVFAGLCDGEHATILTAAAIPSLAEIHGRMPVVLDRDQARTWMTGDPITGAGDLLRPHDVGTLTGEPADPAHANPKPPAQPDLFG